MNKKTALIIGAGPAGLTAAYELLLRTDIHPIVLEKSEYMGGISRTVRLQRQPHRHRRPPLLFQIRPGHELVDVDVMPLEARERRGHRITYHEPEPSQVTATPRRTLAGDDRR